MFAGNSDEQKICLCCFHTPSTAGTFRKKCRRNSGKTPETHSELFLEFPSRVRLGSPRPYNSRHLKAPEHFQNSPPPVRLGTLLLSEMFRRGLPRAGHAIPSSTGGISDFCFPEKMLTFLGPTSRLKVVRDDGGFNFGPNCWRTLPGVPRELCKKYDLRPH